MDPLKALQARVDALEAKACWADDLVEHLNRQVAEQQAQIALLARELARIGRQHADGPADTFRSLRDELPPHY
jgi:SlyX protein